MKRQIEEKHYRLLLDTLQKTHTELEQLHSHTYKECTDKGPNTCPTWEAIHSCKLAIEILNNDVKIIEG